MSTYKLSITKDYCSFWTVHDAIRELLQNMLDSEGESRYRLVKLGGINTLIIQNKGVTLDKKTLLLGSSQKRDNDEAVGMFGEGYKIAFNVLLGASVDVTCYNGRYVWEPSFEFDDAFEDEVLTVLETQISDHEIIRSYLDTINHTENDLTFIVEGFDQDINDEIISRCLYLQSGFNWVETEYGRILKEPYHKGKIFVGGLYICDKDKLEYGYDFSPAYVKLGRDRTILDYKDIKNTVSDMLTCLNDDEVVYHIMDSNSLDTPNTYLVAQSAVDKVADRFIDENGECLAKPWWSDKYENVTATVKYVDDKLYEVLERSEKYRKIKENLENNKDPTPAEVLQNMYREALDLDTEKLYLEEVIEAFIEKLEQRRAIFTVK